MNKKRLLRIIGVASLVATLLLIKPYNTHAAGAVTIQVDNQAVTEPFTRDVFVISGTGDLIVADPRTTLPDTPLFNIAGQALSKTFGQFEGASATSVVAVSRHNNTTSSFVHMVLRGLIPNGVYSIFYATFGPDSNNPLCPGVERALPLPSVWARQKPDASSFVANSGGAARFDAMVNGSLLDVEILEFLVIYHLDGKTYGALPNRGEHVTQGPTCRSSFGSDALRQLLIIQKGF